MARQSSDNGDKPDEDKADAADVTGSEDTARGDEAGPGTGSEAGGAEPPEEAAGAKTEGPWGREDMGPDGSEPETLPPETAETAEPAADGTGTATTGPEDATAKDTTETSAGAETSGGAEYGTALSETEAGRGSDVETATDAPSPAADDAGAPPGSPQAEEAAELTMRSEDDSDPGPARDPETPPAPPPQTVVERRGPGFVPLVLGGIVAAGLGYFASVAEVVPGLGDPGPSPEVEAALNQQADALAALEARIAELAATETEAPDVDLSPVTDEIAGLAARLDETAAAIDGLTDRVVTLEERPVFSGEVTADAAEAAEAVAAMEEQLRQREEEAAARAAEAEEEAQAARDAAAEAEEEAEAARARAEAEAALAALRLAVTRGDPFAEPLADVAEVTDVPEPLAAAADTGVPSLEALQDRFPPVARDALPVALRETAGDSPVDRFAAFVQGQVGGRAVTPRAGDSVDAILSRAQAAVTAGDLDAALAEIAALPEGAQAELAAWTADARARTEVLDALETVTQALAGAN